MTAAPGMASEVEPPKALPGKANSPSDELSAEDLELLKSLDILHDWELLRDWDPEENLPIPVSAPPPAPEREDP